MCYLSVKQITKNFIIKLIKIRENSYHFWSNILATIFICYKRDIVIIVKVYEVKHLGSKKWIYVHYIIEFVVTVIVLTELHCTCI